MTFDTDIEQQFETRFCKMWHESVCFVIVGVVLSVTWVAAVTPIACRENEQLGSCGRICEAKCDSLDIPQCGPNTCDFVDCQCNRGFFRNNQTNTCVRLSECPPPKCRANEVLGDCGKLCEGTCEHPSRPERCMTMKCARPGCQCDLSRGYVRDQQSDMCVRNQENKKCAAKLKCPCNSAPTLCGRYCERTCRDQFEKPCAFLDPTRCVVDCRCTHGTVRNERNGQCIRYEDCPA